MEEMMKMHVMKMSALICMGVAFSASVASAADLECKTTGDFYGEDLVVKILGFDQGTDQYSVTFKYSPEEKMNFRIAKAAPLEEGQTSSLTLQHVEKETYPADEDYE